MKGFKSFCSGVICTVLLAGAITTALAATNLINISVNPNVTVKIDDKPFSPKSGDGKDLMLLNHNGTVYVPVRAFAEELDFCVDWDEGSNTASVNKFAWSDLTYDVDQNLYNKFEELVSFEMELDPNVSTQFVTDRVFVFRCNTSKEEFKKFWSDIAYEQKIAIVKNKAINTMISHDLKGNESCSIYFEYSGSNINGGIAFVIAYDCDVHASISMI